MSRPLPLLAIGMAITAATGAHADDRAPQWMLGVNGGSTERQGDEARAYGSLALTRKLGRGYLRVSVTRFGSVVRQVDVTLPSTYTLGFISAGTTFGNWFVDGYGSIGVQHYRPVRTAIGRRAIRGSRSSGVLGAGGDIGYVRWLGQTWSLTPSASFQYIRSKALREQIGRTGPSEYETRETGGTIGGTVRIDKFLGRDRADSIGVRISHYATSNASAALVSGTRGALSPNAQSTRQADGWTELGGSITLRIRPTLYFDGTMARTLGARAGNVTSTGLGGRLLF